MKLALLLYLFGAVWAVLSGDLVSDQFEVWSDAMTRAPRLRQLASSTGELVCWLPLLTCFPLLYWLQSRFGGAEWGPWGLRVVDMFSGWRRTFLPWQLVETLREVPGGLRAVPRREAGRLLRISGPCLIVPPGEEREAVLKATAPYVGRQFEPEVFGASPRRGEWLLIVVLVGIYLPLVVFADLELTSGGWGESVDGLAMACALTGTLGFIVLAYRALLARSTRVELYQAEGRTGLLRVELIPIPFDEIRLVAREGGAFWFETKTGSRRARIHDEAEAETLAAALGRAGIEVVTTLPWLRRPAIVVPLLWSLAFLSLGVGFLPGVWAQLVPARRALRFVDELGQDVLVVYEESSHEPLLLLALPPDAGLEIHGAYGRPLDYPRWGKEEGLLIDVEAMVWEDRLSGARGSLALIGSATVAPSTSHSALVSVPTDAASLAPLKPVLRMGLTLTLWDSSARIRFRSGQGRSGTVNRSVRSLPGACAKLLGSREGPLGDFLSGRTSRRIYDLRGITTDMDLIAAVVWGRVVWAVLIPRDSPQTLSGSGVGYQIQTGGNLLQLSPGLWRAHVGGALTEIRAAPPTLADLERVEARLRESAPAGDELIAAPGQ